MEWGSYSRSNPPISGSLGMGSAKGAGIFAAMTIGLELYSGVQGHINYFKLSGEKRKFSDSMKYLAYAQEDVLAAFETGEYIPPSLQTKEGFSAIANYILSGEFSILKENRTILESIDFMHDVELTGDKIIEDFSSERKEYPNGK